MAAPGERLIVSGKAGIAAAGGTGVAALLDTRALVDMRTLRR